MTAPTGEKPASAQQESEPDTRLSRFESARYLNIGFDTLRNIIEQGAFPAPAADNTFSRGDLEQWRSTPRCTYGTGQDKCWQEANTNNTHGLLMCPKHTKQAESILNRKTA